MFKYLVTTQQTRYVYLILVQCWPSVTDDRPTFVTVTRVTSAPYRVVAMQTEWYPYWVRERPCSIRTKPCGCDANVWYPYWVRERPCNIRSRHGCDAKMIKMIKMLIMLKNITTFPYVALCDVWSPTDTSGEVMLVLSCTESWWMLGSCY